MRVEATAITMDNAATVAAAGVAAIESGDHVIDLSAVTRCDSSAVAALLAWKRAAAARSIFLEIVGAPRALASLVSVYGVDELIETSSAA
jgi:phospholipid transport system transporter-binding protein